MHTHTLTLLCKHSQSESPGGKTKAEATPTPERKRRRKSKIEPLVINEIEEGKEQCDFTWCSLRLDGSLHVSQYTC